MALANTSCAFVIRKPTLILDVFGEIVTGVLNVCNPKAYVASGKEKYFPEFPLVRVSSDNKMWAVYDVSAVLDVKEGLHTPKGEKAFGL